MYLMHIYILYYIVRTLKHWKINKFFYELIGNVGNDILSTVLIRKNSEAYRNRHMVRHL